MAEVTAIKLDSLNLQVDGAGHIVGIIHIGRIFEQLKDIKPTLDNGCIEFRAEKRRHYHKEYTHMPPLYIQWGSESPSEHTPSSNGQPVKQSAPDEAL